MVGREFLVFIVRKVSPQHHVVFAGLRIAPMQEKFASPPGQRQMRRGYHPVERTIASHPYHSLCSLDWPLPLRIGQHYDRQSQGNGGIDPGHIIGLSSCYQGVL